MISAADFIHLPYTKDLTEGGIAYAIRSLPYTYDRMGGSPFDRLRRIVAGVAVELAFRRYLTEQDIPFDVKGATPFTEPDRYDVSLGGHRCDIKSFLITHREQISDMRHNPEIILKAPALVPSDQHVAAGHTDNDLYLFAFSSGLIAASQADLKKVMDSDQPYYLLHAMPDSWCRPTNWNPLGRLVLKSESNATQQMEIAGQDESREFLTRTVELQPRTRVEILDAFFSISSIHIKSSARARIGLRSETRKETYLINPADWGNIWVYGIDILLAGYIGRRDFSQQASFVQPGSRVFQYNRTRAKNLAVPVSDLKPLLHLLQRVQEWDSKVS
jgi:hypothetical protein